ncbi:MAG: CehA/McbA family metallohydrolase [Vicinamibacterales bacterium]|nr:CehA/McbA family metallohydrolase [Vicinamibacterales bacterium]
MRLRVAVGAVVAILTLGSVISAQQPGSETLRWFKGNTHTHSLNSDGDSAPDDVVRWYREHRYHFVVMTDHNIVTPVEGLNAVYAVPDRFLVIRGEEVTDSAAKKPVHLNLIGGDGFVAPQGAATPAEALRRNIAAMRLAKGVISINHPNFGWALTADDLVSAGNGAELLEIANAHPLVNNQGNGSSPGAEALWDSMLTAGIMIYGVASDDMHELKRPWLMAAARPGQAWVVVRAPRLAEEAILASLARGDFYSSTGIELTDIQTTAQRVTLKIKEQSSSRYTVRFIGRGGQMLKEVTAAPYQYDIVGTEGYVRAKVVDSNGLIAWTQPVVVGQR